MTKLLVNIDVPELELAVEFYTRAFLLTIGRRFGPHAVELLGAEAPIYLLAKRPGSTPYPGATATRHYGRHWSPVHLDFAVPNLAEAMRRAEDAGAKRESDVADYPWGRISFYADPWGHGFCLIEFSERGYDAISTTSPTEPGA